MSKNVQCKLFLFYLTVLTIKHQQHQEFYRISNIVLNHSHICLQCFDAVGWVAGRDLACKKLSGGVLAWLSV